MSAASWLQCMRHCTCTSWGPLACCALAHERSPHARACAPVSAAHGLPHRACPGFSAGINQEPHLLRKNWQQILILAWPGESRFSTGRHMPHSNTAVMAGCHKAAGPRRTPDVRNLFRSSTAGVGISFLIIALCARCAAVGHLCGCLRLLARLLFATRTCFHD